MPTVLWQWFRLDDDDGQREALAEGVRFELTRELAPPAGFQDRCLKPLGHPSGLEFQALSKSANGLK